MGLIGTNRAGSLEANRLYFSDYLQAGRVLARGNLFVYTLPSSPLAEAAIHFGFQGPMLYMGFPVADSATYWRRERGWSPTARPACWRSCRMNWKRWLLY